MRQLKLGIYDEDQGYAMGLMAYMNADKENTIFTMAFSSKEKLLEYLADKNLDILLVAETDYQDMDILTAVKNREMCILGLTERKQSDDRRLLFRYASASDLVKQILLAFRASDVSGKRSELFTCYGVISPIGRAGKTELAKSICLMDEVRGGLYIGMEAYGTPPVGFEDADNTDDRVSEEHLKDRMDGRRRYTMGDLAYLIKTRSDRMLEYVERSIEKKDRISEIASPESYLDLREMTAEDMRWFLATLTNWGCYTTIVCDIGGSVLGDLAILGEFDRIIVPDLPGEKEQTKRNAFEMLLKKTDLKKVAERMQIVEVPNVSYDSSEMLRTVGKLVEG